VPSSSVAAEEHGRVEERDVDVDPVPGPSYVSRPKLVKVKQNLLHAIIM